MKLFNRGKEEAAPAAAAPAPAPVAPAAPAAPAPPPEPQGGGQESIAALLDASVKEISEKISRITASVEAVHNDRAAFEEKIVRMEDRMRKLASLTEMISSQYNPFLGDKPPEEEGQPQAAPSPVASAPIFEAPPPAPVAPSPLPPPVPLDFPFPMDPPVAPAAPPPPPPEAAVAALPAFLEPPAPAPAEVAEPEVAPSPLREEEAASFAEEELPKAPGEAHLDRVEGSFQNSITLLNWANALLQGAGSRKGFDALLEYYKDIGWIGEELQDQLRAYANGLPCPERNVNGDWRAEVALHERSLLYLKALQPARRSKPAR